MSRYPTMASLLAANSKGHTLPQQLYVGEEAFRFDTEVMLPSVWLFACTVAHIKKPGDWFLFEMASNSVIIVRGKDGEPRAFFNSCRHRGSRLCEAQQGHAAKLICPYHQWTYSLDGALFGARNMFTELLAISNRNQSPGLLMCATVQANSQTLGSITSVSKRNASSPT